MNFIRNILMLLKIFKIHKNYLKNKEVFNWNYIINFFNYFNGLLIYVLDKY